jgi:hypothetical protein
MVQIRRAHEHARPNGQNPAWLNSHNDMTYTLIVVDDLVSALSRLLQNGDVRDAAHKGEISQARSALQLATGEPA